jgi:hypothetical protein
MTRIPYDQAAKALFMVELARAGRVVAQQEVAGEPQWVDVFFERDPDAATLPGLLGRVAEESCLIEVFHEAPGVEVVRDALCKQLVAHQRRRDGRSGEQKIISLWIFAAGRAGSVIRRFGLQQRVDWPVGVHAAAEGFGWNLVVVPELPRTRDTLLVRLLGSGQTLREAVHEVRALGPEGEEARAARAVLAVLRSAKRLPEDPTERAIVMEARETHEEWMERMKREGREEGREQGLAPLMRQFERVLGRALTRDERADIGERLRRLGAERLGDVVLDLDAASLAEWLADPLAR